MTTAAEQPGWVKAILAIALTLGGANSLVVAAPYRRDARQAEKPAGVSYFPPSDSQGGWRSLQGALRNAVPELIIYTNTK